IRQHLLRSLVPLWCNLLSTATSSADQSSKQRSAGTLLASFWEISFECSLIFVAHVFFGNVLIAWESFAIFATLVIFFFEFSSIIWCTVRNRPDLIVILGAIGRETDAVHGAAGGYHSGIATVVDHTSVHTQ